MSVMGRYAKWWIALTGAVAQILGQGLVTGTAAKWLAIIVAAITAAAVFRVPNDPAPTPPARANS